MPVKELAWNVTVARMPLPLGPGGESPNEAHEKTMLVSFVVVGGQNTVRPVLPRKGLFTTLTNVMRVGSYWISIS